MMASSPAAASSSSASPPAGPSTTSSPTAALAFAARGALSFLFRLSRWFFFPKHKPSFGAFRTGQLLGLECR
ncbi:histone H1 gonadal [Biomphalaria glabrata]